jgi:hypothetical protein
MKIRKSILTTAAGLMLAAFSGMALASASPQKQPSPAVTKQSVPKSNNKAVTGVSRGTITSIDNDRLVLSHRKKDGKAEELTFMLSPKTERKGELTSGSQISVHYRTENNQLMATAIQAVPQKTASHAAKPVVKK